MTALAEVFVAVKPDMDKFGPEVKKKLARIDAKKEGSQVAGRFGVGFNGAFGGIVKRSAGLFVGAFAAVKSVEIFGGFIKDAADSARVSRLTAAAIKSTGSAAKVTAAQVGDLATAISNKTGADDETVQSGANLLLTFTNIRNEVGKNNDIFNQATSTVTDMAAALNNGEVSASGVKSASIQLGKALNDPVKGITALQKVGVSFTDGQKKQIESLVKSGKTMEAQKVILGELKKEFGGAAAAAGDPFTRLTTIFGNLGEELGGYVLPYAEKFANFISNKLIPGVSGLVSLLVKGDFTKGFREAFGVEEDSGFVDFLFKVRDGAIAAFGFFKSDVLPVLQSFGGYLVHTVVPAVSGFVSNLVSSLAPAVKDVFGFFKAEVIPRLKDFGGFLGGSVLPKVGALATSLSKNKDFLVPFAATIVTIIAALKTWAIVQGVLNAVMSANPIGLVVVAIAALVGGLVYAYKHSDRFRQIVDAAFKIVAASGKFMWEAVLKPVFGLLAATFQFVWKRAQFWSGVLIAAFNALKGPAVTVFRFIINVMFGFIDSMLTGAAKAFGWIPGIGPKLKNAAREFNTFKNSVNNALDGLKDQTITVTAKLNSSQMRNRVLNDPRQRNAYATGGPVFGAGTATSDSIPALLSNGEHVWTAKEVQKAGGHAAVEKMRRTVAGYATGGGVDVKARTSNVSRFSKEVAAHAVAAIKPAAQELANQMFGPGGPPGSVQAFRGVRLNERTIRMLLSAERMLGRVFHIMQGSYSTRVAASGGTHAGGGAMDTDGPGGWNAAVSALRRAGFAAWHRTPAQGPWGHHIHSIAIGDPTASAAARRQVQSYLRGGDGLGMRKGGPVYLRDNGGPLPHGSFAYNNSGKTEWVVPGGRPGGMNVTVNVPAVVGMTRQDLRNYLVSELDTLRRQRRI
jgi:hypothetical protein